MAKYPVKGAGDTHTGENPSVTSKFDRSGGMPRTPAKVGGPGKTAEPPIHHHRISPTRVKHAEHGKVHTYSPDHPTMGGQHHGAKPRHPTNDPAQEAYEKHGYGGGRGK